MLRKDYIKDNLLTRKLTDLDLANIHTKIKERYYTLSEWNLADTLGKRLAVEVDKLIKLYVLHNNPALYKINKRCPSFCSKLDNLTVTGFASGDKQGGFYTEERGGVYNKIVKSIALNVSFDSLVQKPPIILNRFGAMSSFKLLNDWVTSSMGTIPELKPLITKIRTIQNGIIKSEYKRINDKVSSLYIVSDSKTPYSYTTEFKGRKNIVTVEDLFDFDPELFLYYCSSKGIKSYLKTWKMPSEPGKEDDLDSMVERVKKIL